MVEMLLHLQFELKTGFFGGLPYTLEATGACK